ncbi:MAG TPA: transglutaminase-like domain-containing protein [Dyella sp.]|uniref:transglutaminase-like domain-containing protein n=1 Tax=Dyella sp. TaxID=1869338 RepID=UPI002D79C8C7|nr:transglutaminase-like domain-containing protein [Dyella sp.]HET6551908.1 transglutaminase-like domain-containing protein [Dyella sp.]
MLARVPKSLRPRKAAPIALALACLLAVSHPAHAAPDTTASVSPAQHAIALVDAGQFKSAEADITTALAQPGLPQDTRDALLFQRERMRRILIDFTLDADAAKARIRKQIPDLTDAEFARWDQQGLIEHMVIDGRTLYFKRAPGNLFLLSKEAAARRTTPATSGDDPMETLNEHHRAARAEALATHRTSVTPNHVRVTETVTVDADAVPAGETIRAWLPFARELPGQQEQVKLVDSQPAGAKVAPASTLQRTAYMEKKAEAGKPTTFGVTYELTIYAQYHDIDANKVVATRLTPDLKPYVEERAPHIVFTDDLRAFSRKVVGDEKNPYRIAQKLFAAVDQIPWAGAREYSTISNLSDYTLHAGHGDCGQQTMLLITLLRLNGIPARWQSGWIFSDGTYDNIHDWGQLYLAPYGWVPMDVTFGQLQPGKGDDPALQWFYLGGLDAYRIAFNSDFSQPFVPAKQHFRSETVDSQRGELEWRGGNLYFNQWDYNFKWQLLPVTNGR